VCQAGREKDSASRDRDQRLTALEKSRKEEHDAGSAAGLNR